MAVNNKLIVAFTTVCFIAIAAVNGSAIRQGVDENRNVASCQSPIFCRGELLHTIQMARIFNDSKTFVDMKLKRSPNITLELFREFMAENDGQPSREAIRKFVNATFDRPGSEFADWVPLDWHPSPKFLENIRDPVYRQFARNVHGLWKILGRQLVDDVTENPDLYSIIHVPNPVIVPGDRFLEYYYWDSYWIIRGLLYSEMFETAKGMLENFLSLIDRFGFLPCGGRLYYVEQTQPPLLAGMIKSYVDATNDIAFLNRSLPFLEREFNFFLNNRMVNVSGHLLATYNHTSTGPRPESYYEDIDLASHLPTESERQDVYAELKAATESGMDFSSRWFIKNGTNEGRLIDTKCRSIVPVELNAILFWNAKILAEFSTRLNNPSKAAEFESKAMEFYTGVQAVLWNEEAGTWLDYDMINERPRNYFVVTNLSPLWTGCFNTSDTARLAARTLAYINSTGIDRFPAGVPNTLRASGEQWDYPNAWPPMQYTAIEALRALNDTQTDQIALGWTSRWVLTNFLAYNRTRYMFEKYNALELGSEGGGGEYEIQSGFGWTNGIVLELLARFGDVLSLFDGF